MARPLIESSQVPTLFGGAVFLALAGWVLWLAPNARLHRALGLFLFANALLLLTSGLASGITNLAFRLHPYTVIAVPYAALNLGIVLVATYGHGHHGLRRPLVRRTARWALLAALVATEAAYLLDHGFFLEPGRAGPLILFAPLADTANAGLALVALALAWNTPETRRRGSLFLMAFALVLSPLYRGTYYLLENLAFGFLPGALERITAVLDTTTLLLSLLVIGLLVRPVADHRPTITDRPLALTVATSVAGGAVVALLIEFVRPDLWFFVFGTLHATWVVMMGLLLVFAAVRYQLFGIELHAKRVVTSGSVAAFIGAGFFIASESIEQLIPTTNLVESLAGGALVSLGLFPVMKGTRRLADRLLPGVQQDAAYVEARRHELYRAALESAYYDDEVTDRERRVVETLRERLGIGVEEARALEAEIRSAHTA